MIIKICGLTTIRQALVAADAGAHMIGLVFAPSRRQLSPEAAAAIVAALRDRPGPQPLAVGLFVNTQPATINAIVAQVGLDMVQLSGTEPPHERAMIDRPLLRAFRMDGSPDEAAWLAAALEGASGQWARAGEAASGTRLLVDAHVPGAYGGTGMRADWTQAAALARRVPLMLAGGLTPANVAAGIAAVQPWGVDVSSGVETDGQKDSAKIEAFIAAAHAAQ